ncbi:MAG: histone H1 [Candidatus Rokubacteria bacterium]|nr:histone H1 [Candidatus Rokubacteria bacterium]
MPKRPPRPRDPMQLAKLIGDIAIGEVENVKPAPTTPATEARRKGGLKGGKARAKKLRSAARLRIARKAAAARWSKKPKTSA